MSSNDKPLDVRVAFGTGLADHTLLTQAFAQISTAIAIIDVNGYVTYTNKALFRLWRLNPAGFSGSPINAAWQLSGMPSLLLALTMNGSQRWHGETALKRADGTFFTAEIHANPIWTQDGKPGHLVVTFADVTSRKKAEDRIARLARMYAAISTTVESVFQAETPKDILAETCRIVVTEGSVTKAWAGLVDEASGTVRQLAHCGMNLERFENLFISLDPTIPEGRGPSAVAIRSGKPVVIDDLQKNPITQPWWDYSRQEGLHSLASVPIRCAGKVIGVITFLASIHDVFDDEMVELLDRISINTALALERVEALRLNERLMNDLEARVQERTKELNEAIRELETFSYTVSHDLRAPLRAIDGFTALAMEECSGQLGERGLSYLERVRSSTCRMGTMMDSLMDLAHASRTTLKRAYFDMVALMRTTIENLRREDPMRQVIFELPQQMYIEADVTLMQVVIDNLLSNAWKYTARRELARISIGALDQDGTPVYYVQDNGVGFEMKSAGKIFQAFQRLHDRTDYEGTGIGLSTVQRIIQRHGGQIWAESSPGAGATFYFTLKEKLGENEQ